MPKIRAKDSERLICIGCEDPDQPVLSDMSVSNEFKSEEHAKRIKTDPQLVDKEMATSSDKRNGDSDRISKQLAQKMLQGYALLQDECPNPTCHGIPLMRDRNKRLECVNCQGIFSPDSPMKKPREPKEPEKEPEREPKERKEESKDENRLISEMAIDTLMNTIDDLRKSLENNKGQISDITRDIISCANAVRALREMELP